MTARITISNGATFSYGENLLYADLNDTFTILKTWVSAGN
jgi:hypothetical protein